MILFDGHYELKGIIILGIILITPFGNALGQEFYEGYWIKYKPAEIEVDASSEYLRLETTKVYQDRFEKSGLSFDIVKIEVTKINEHGIDATITRNIDGNLESAEIKDAVQFLKELGSAIGFPIVVPTNLKLGDSIEITPEFGLSSIIVKELKEISINGKSVEVFELSNQKITEHDSQLVETGLMAQYDRKTGMLLSIFPSASSAKPDGSWWSVKFGIEAYDISEPPTCEDIDVQKFISRKYSTIDDYPLLYELASQGLAEKNLDNSGILMVYRGNIHYDNECQTFFKDYKQLGKDVQRWRNSCTDLGEYPNAYLGGEMYNAINGLCGFADLSAFAQSVEESKPESPQGTEIVCGTGTIEKNGQCVPERATMTTEMQQKSSNGGGCLIATATYGSELAPQVQQLRELRDNTLLQTKSGSAFMSGFNQFYYSFSPSIADYERENPVFKEAVKLTITPLLASLSILNYVNMDSEAEVLGFGLSVIALNIGMYFVAPVIVIMRFRKK